MENVLSDESKKNYRRKIFGINETWKKEKLHNFEILIFPFFSCKMLFLILLFFETQIETLKWIGPKQKNNIFKEYSSKFFYRVLLNANELAFKL